MGEFLFLKPGQVDIGAGRILKRDEYSLLVEARGIIDAARKEAERTAEEAKAAYEEEKKRGFAEGLEEGRMEMAMNMLHSASESVNMISSMEDSIIDVVIRSVRTIIGDLDDNEVVERLVKRALQYVRDQKKVTIRLNPEDAETMEDKLGAITRDFPSSVRFEIVPDARLDRKMCTMETEMGIVDASLEKQLNYIESALRSEVGSHGGQ